MKLTCTLFFLLAVASNLGSNFFTSCSVDSSSVSQQTYRVPYLQRLSELIALSSHQGLSDKRADEKKNLRRKREDSDSTQVADDEDVTSAATHVEEQAEDAEEDLTSNKAGIPQEEDASGEGISLDGEQWEDEDEHDGGADPSGPTPDYHYGEANAPASIPDHHYGEANAPASIPDYHYGEANAPASIPHYHYDEANAEGPITHEHYGEANAPASIPDYHYGEANAAGPMPHYHYDADGAPPAGAPYAPNKLDEQAEDAFIRFFSQKPCITLPGEERSEKCNDAERGDNKEYDIKITYNEKEEHINRGENKCVNLNLNLNNGSPPSEDGPSNVFINLSFVPNIPEEIINDFYAIIKRLKHMFEFMDPQEGTAPVEEVGSEQEVNMERAGSEEEANMERAGSEEEANMERAGSEEEAKRK
ncbi:merozoite surface protein Pv50 [Plasmodium vivax]|uniref:Merozoite surface protein Pv50 n=1 Tax=Plasmodium vivax TaxID=5855 RepID=A0A564ZTN1_PLAVI|nr:merozoite surface protein Pv50 [Plasmodium vivax]